MIYGANGYTGELVARKARLLGMKPVIAGRNEKKIMSLASELGFESRVFSLDNIRDTAFQLKDIDLVLHCAGPFIETAEIMARACLQTQTHYMDITGEIPVFETLQSLDHDARENFVMLLPGVGFDIVPTDCMAARLIKEVPGAQRLSLAFLGLANLSRGTLKSMLGQIAGGSKIRRNKVVTEIPQFSLSREIDFDGKKHRLYAIPWGDVFTAWYTTGIENIEVYSYFPEALSEAVKLIEPVTGIFKNEFILKGAQAMVDTLFYGPSEDDRLTLKTRLWAEVIDADGAAWQMRMNTAEGYQFTVDSCIEAIQEIFTGKAKPGFHTPSQIFGADFVERVSGTEITMQPARV